MLTALLSRLDGPQVKWIAAAITLALGLVFALIWSPHPWGWLGIDQYHQLAVSLARGEPFSTTDVPWAYAYYVASFYRLFGEHPWLPVLFQVIANAAVPLLLYAIAAQVTDRRHAGLAALLIGVFSFNTVYASTQSSDALCTVTFLGALWCLQRAHRSSKPAWYAAAGLLSGLMPQFRPNLILLPLIAAVLVVLLSKPRRRAIAGAITYLAVFAAVLAPWTIRNYRLTETFLPSSSHGGVQLWYGTLQVGEYLESRAHNPRSVFETPPFDYFSIAGPSIVVSASLRGCAPAPAAAATLVYRTDRDRNERRVSGVTANGTTFTFDIPGQRIPTTIYYWFETAWADQGPGDPTATPVEGGRTPLVFFVSDDHLGDLDIHDDLIDVADVIRVVQHLAWQDASSRPLDFAEDGRIDRSDLAALIARLVPNAPAATLDVAGDVATLRFADGSTFRVPRQLSRLTDLEIAGDAAIALSFARLPRWAAGHDLTAGSSCRQLEDITVNAPFYRREPHMMRRYTALAFDNIARDPAGFAAASLYRAARLFLIRGTDDQMTTQQFDSSDAVYLTGTVLSGLYLGLFIAGVVVCIRQRSRALILLVPIVYVPATICFVLTNMRYTITVQPLMFVFVAAALLAVLGARSAR